MCKSFFCFLFNPNLSESPSSFSPSPSSRATFLPGSASPFWGSGVSRYHLTPFPATCLMLPHSPSPLHLLAREWWFLRSMTPTWLCGCVLTLQTICYFLCDSLPGQSRRDLVSHSNKTQGTLNNVLSLPPPHR